jgi:prophage regulatory protein
MNFRADRIIREGECQNLTGVSRTTRWRLIREGRFPSSIKISAGCSGWKLSDIEKWIENLGKKAA